MKACIMTICCLFILSFAVSADAQVTAKTSDGRTVILKEDGTWEIVEPSADTSNVGFHFRKTRWGMSRKQVIAAEGRKPDTQQDDWIAYNENVADFDCYLFYTFAQDKLALALYHFVQTHSNKNQYLSDFAKIKQILMDVYGEPVDDKENWSQSLYKNDPEHWGLAVSIGHLSRYVSFENDDTDIMLALTGDNFEVRLDIHYASKAHKYLPKERHLKDF